MTTSSTSKRFNDVAGFTLQFPPWDTTLPSTCLPGWFYRMARQDDGGLNVFLIEQNHGATYETGLRLWTVPAVQDDDHEASEQRQRNLAEHKVAALEFCLRGAVHEAVQKSDVVAALHDEVTELNNAVKARIKKIGQNNEEITALRAQMAQRDQWADQTTAEQACLKNIAVYTEILLAQQGQHVGTALTKETLRGLLGHLKVLQDESVKTSVQRLAGQEETPVAQPALPSTLVVIPNQVFTKKIPVIKAVMDATDRRYSLRDAKQEIVEGALPFAVRADHWYQFIQAMDNAGARCMIMVDESGKQYGPVHANDDIEAMKERIRASLLAPVLAPTETPENFAWVKVTRDPTADRDRVRAILAIKLIREFGGLSLKEAKDAWDLGQWFRIRANQLNDLRVQVTQNYGFLWDAMLSDVEPVNHAPVHYLFGTTGF